MGANLTSQVAALQQFPKLLDHRKHQLGTSSFGHAGHFTHMQNNQDHWLQAPPHHVDERKSSSTSESCMTMWLPVCVVMPIFCLFRMDCTCYFLRVLHAQNAGHPAVDVCSTRHLCTDCSAASMLAVATRGKSGVLTTTTMCPVIQQPPYLRQGTVDPNKSPCPSCLWSRLDFFRSARNANIKIDQPQYAHPVRTTRHALPQHAVRPSRVFFV